MWLEIARTAHQIGLRSNATMLYGHIETIEERVDHLLQLRALQDETGGFVAFIPLAFHPANTALAHLPPTTARDDLKNIAVARLLLDNFDHIKAYWIMLTPSVAQVALQFGADDLDGTVIEEKIYHDAGSHSPQHLTRQELERLIRAAGRRASGCDPHAERLNKAGGLKGARTTAPARCPAAGAAARAGPDGRRCGRPPAALPADRSAPCRAESWRINPRARSAFACGASRCGTRAGCVPTAPAGVRVGRASSPPASPGCGVWDSGRTRRCRSGRCADARATARPCRERREPAGRGSALENWPGRAASRRGRLPIRAGAADARGADAVRRGAQACVQSFALA